MTRRLTPEQKARDRKYQDSHDAEVARIRASVPDAPPSPIPAGQCQVCHRDYFRFGSFGYTHAAPADHEVQR